MLSRMNSFNLGSGSPGYSGTNTCEASARRRSARAIGLCKKKACVALTPVSQSCVMPSEAWRSDPVATVKTNKGHIGIVEAPHVLRCLLTSCCIPVRGTGKRGLVEGVGGIACDRTTFVPVLTRCGTCRVMETWRPSGIPSTAYLRKSSGALTFK